MSQITRARKLQMLSVLQVEGDTKSLSLFSEAVIITECKYTKALSRDLHRLLHSY